MSRCTTAPTLPVTPRPRPGAAVHIDESVTPDIADERGHLRAGKVLEWLDVVGALAASRYAGHPVVTASVEGVELHEPVRVGEHVALTAAVSFTSGRSLGISVHMNRWNEVERCLSAYMTFVAVDPDGGRVEVPPFSPETPEERARYREGVLRREFRQQLDAGQLPVVAAPAFPLGDDRAGDRTRAPLVQWMRQLRASIVRAEAPAPRSPQHSFVHKIEPIRKSALNFHDTLYGGALMGWVETAGNLSARAYLGRRPAVFRGLLAMSFLRPVPENVFVHLRAAAVHTTSDDVTTLVSVQSEDPLHGKTCEVARAFATFAPDETDTSVPPLRADADEERAIADEVEQRLALQRQLAGAL